MPQKYVRTIWEKLSEKSCEFIDGYDECTSEKFDLDDICQVGFKQVSGDNTQLVQYYIAYMNTVFVVPFFYSCEGTISKNGMKSGFHLIQSILKEIIKLLQLIFHMAIGLL